MFFNHTSASSRNNTDGAFSMAPLGDLNLEWGPPNNDVRHRLNISLNNQIIKNLAIALQRQLQQRRAVHAAHRA